MMIFGISDCYVPLKLTQYHLDIVEVDNGLSFVFQAIYFKLFTVIPEPSFSALEIEF